MLFRTVLVTSQKKLQQEQIMCIYHYIISNLPSHTSNKCYLNNTWNVLLISNSKRTMLPNMVIQIQQFWSHFCEIYFLNNWFDKWVNVLSHPVELNIEDKWSLRFQLSNAWYRALREVPSRLVTWPTLKVMSFVWWSSVILDVTQRVYKVSSGFDSFIFNWFDTW